MIKSPLLSVIMPVYNGGNYLIESISSILSQTFTDFEFIIINDGSKDNSLSVILNFASQDERIIVVNRENKGLVYSLNEGLALARGQYIARMDADDISSISRFENQINKMQSENGDICGCHFTLISESNKILNTFISPISVESIYCFLTVTNPFAHGSVIFRKKFIDENNLMYQDKKAEDHHLWVDFYENGAKFISVNDFLFSYRVHKESISRSKEKEMMKEVRKNGKMLVTKYNKEFRIYLEQLAVRELTFLEEQIYLICAIRFSIANRNLFFLNCIKRISKRAVFLSLMKLILGKVG